MANSIVSIKTLEPAINQIFDEVYTDQAKAIELDELKAWLEGAYPEVFKQYNCIKDITNEPK